MSDQQTQQQQYLEAQADLNRTTDAQAAAVRGALSKQVEQYQNAGFLQAIQAADVDSPVWDWLEDDLGPVFSGAHILGERPRSYAEEADLLEANAAERVIAESSPGRFLKEDHELLAIAQDVHGVDDPDFRDPIGSGERRAIRDAYDVAAQRKTMSIGGAGRDTVGTVQTETRTNKNEQQEQTTASRLSRIFG
jgi:hypothetical protein